MGWSLSDIGHTVLDVAGMVPVIGEAADGVNAAWYLAEGDKFNAALSAASMIPLAGNVATGAKWINRGADAIELAGKAARGADDAVDAGRAIARGADEAVDVARGADEAVDVARGADDAAGAARGADDAARAARGAEADSLTLRGTPYRIPGWEMEPLSYTKRAPDATAELRAAFDGGVRKDFLKDLGGNHADDLRAAGLTEAQIDRVASGRVPQGYQVHHLKPLDDGGTNDFDNLVLIRNDPDHMLVTNHQNAVTRGMEPGDTRQVEWPMPQEPTAIWPDRPGAGAVPLAAE